MSDEETGLTVPPYFVGMKTDLAVVPAVSAAPDYTSVHMTFSVALGGPEAWRGDGGHWTFDVTTVQPDITAFELAQIMAASLTLSDGLMDRLKSYPGLLRHFRREGGFV